MARTIKALNHTQIDKAKPKDKLYRLADGNGLYLSIRPTGAKNWTFNYKKPFSDSKDGRTNITIGDYPSISLLQAREISREYLALLAQNIDPKSHREQQEEEKKKALNSTFQNVAKLWFEDRKLRANFSEKTAIDTWRLLERHLFPAFGNMPISEMTANNVIKVLKPLQAKGTLETLKRTIQKLNEVMTYAIHHDILTDNRMANLSKAFDSPQVQHMRTIRPEELGEFLTALAKAQIHPQTRLLIQWQLLTMTRPNEAATAKFEDIDERARTWTIFINKGLKETAQGRKHIVTLSRQALAVLAEIKKINGGGRYLFPSIKDPSTHCNTQTANAAIKRMGYHGKLVAHGLRSIASTALNEQGFNKDWIEVALSHIDKDKIRQAYNRALYLEDRARMLQWWGDYVENAAKDALPEFHLKIVND
ncbi:integrase arm-type DNA-binding domain-containing protein [Rodentibacter haemolyticus]|uniref:Tyrosine-type recombinase/integrase n=1 Tax=Rodentibacter haemolyticus TaxID=2778911 RepID=A0ABX6UX24_9PAST|nr:integrase arm-type DNA-binding domain-containing protein [Rodentibacter haemolyticus]QPB42655.1 tyrosine-type recombinase/integrase [Rodentibacter haemolyticus]